MTLSESLLQDEVLERHLKRKRDAFAEEYGIAGKPAFFWQCLPMKKVTVDVHAEGIQNALRLGKGTDSSDGWWYGFRSNSVPSLVFDGISSSKLMQAEWATQLHEDGHLIAGIWTFHELQQRDGAVQLAVPTFFAEAFRDFGDLLANCYAAAEYNGDFALTCTLEGADKLALAGARENVIAPAVSRKSLRWPLANVAELKGTKSVCYQMGMQLMRAYGKAMKPWVD